MKKAIFHFFFKNDICAAGMICFAWSMTAINNSSYIAATVFFALAVCANVYARKKATKTGEQT